MKILLFLTFLKFSNVVMACYGFLNVVLHDSTSKTRPTFWPFMQPSFMPSCRDLHRTQPNKPTYHEANPKIGVYDKEIIAYNRKKKTAQKRAFKLTEGYNANANRISDHIVPTQGSYRFFWRVLGSMPPLRATMVLHDYCVYASLPYFHHHVQLITSPHFSPV